MRQEILRIKRPIVWAIPLFLIASIARAEPELSEPQLLIKDTSERLKVALKENPPAGNYDRASQIVTEILEPHVDFVRVSALVLGKHWKTATTDQKRRFIKEFRDLLVHTYAVAFAEYKDWDIRYAPLHVTPNDDKVFVKTEIIRSDAQPVSVDYKMARKDNTWKVYDVVIEGVSFIYN
ncbi:MAG: MlaC/ttg2D family ABC transporter substrate-binding protein, partial [Methylococcales bacterium]